MVNVLKNILTQRPDNLLANFEMISRHTKQDTFKGDDDRLLDDDVKSNAFDIASNQKNLFTKTDEAEEMEAEVRHFILKFNSHGTKSKIPKIRRGALAPSLLIVERMRILVLKFKNT